MWLVRRLPRVRGRYPQQGYAHRRQREATVSYDARDRVGQIAAPTLILHGRRDRTIPLVMAEELRAAIAGSRLEVFRGGHLFSFLGERRAFLARVEEFLDR